LRPSTIDVSFHQGQPAVAPRRARLPDHCEDHPMIGQRVAVGSLVLVGVRLLTRLVDLAAAKLGPVPDDRCYCLKVPAVLGGQYEVSNFGTNSRNELISFSGDLAQQIKDLPDGAQVSLTLTG